MGLCVTKEAAGRVCTIKPKLISVQFINNQLDSWLDIKCTNLVKDTYNVCFVYCLKPEVWGRVGPDPDTNRGLFSK